MPGPARPIRPPFKPLLTAGAIRFLDSLLTPESVVFEWGSGASTLWLADRVAWVTSVEHDVDWYGEVVEALRMYQSGISVLLFTDAAEDHYNYVTAIGTYPDRYFDLVFVDGLDRTRLTCVNMGMPKVKPEGWLVLDDSHWGMLKPARLILADWHIVTIKGRKPSWDGGKPGMTQTSFYQRPL